MMRKIAVAGVAAACLATVLTGCTPDYPQGPSGRVVGKPERLGCVWIGVGQNRHQDCRWKYWLTTQDATGQHTFRVTGDVYGDCVRGGRYPKCTQR